MIRSVTKSEGNVCVFHLKEDLPPKKVKSFLRKVSDLIDGGRVNIILDLSSVSEISTIGLVAISSLFNRCRSLGGSLKICSLTPPVRAEFRETNLINTVEVFDTPLEAMKAFHSQNLLKARNYSGSFYIENRNAFVAWDRIPMTEYLN